MLMLMAVRASVPKLRSVAMPAQARAPKTGALPQGTVVARGPARRLGPPPAVSVAASTVERMAWVPTARMPRHSPAVLVATWAVEVTAWVLAPLPREPAVLRKAGGMMALAVWLGRARSSWAGLTDLEQGACAGC